MEYFIIKEGKVLWLTEEEFNALDVKKLTPEQNLKDATPSERQAFQEERYKKFIEPLMRYNIQALQAQEEKRTVVARRKSWLIDPRNCKKNQ